MLTKLHAVHTQRNYFSNLLLKFVFGLFSLIWMQISFAQSSNPSLNLGNNQIICSGSNTATVSATTNNLGALTVSSYAWTVEGVSVGTSSSTSITVNASLSPNNPQDVNCVATLSDGSTINDNMKVFTISPGVIAGDQFSCSAPYNPNEFTSTSGGTTSLSNVNNFSHSYQWESATNVNGPWTSISGATSATYAPSNLNSTTYFRRVLEVTIGNNNPISQSCISNVLVIQIINTPSITNNQCIANGATANMSVSFNPALPSGYTATYSWTGPNSYSAASATATVTSFAANKAGTYTANISVSNGNNTCTYSLTTQLNLIPNTPTFSIPTTGCPGTSFQPTGFTAQTTPSTINYQWSISPSNGGSTGLNSTSPTFLFNSGDTYSISVTATNSSGGCSASSSTNNISIPTFSSENPTVGVAGSFYNPQIINGVNTIAICAGLSVSAVTIYNNNTSNNGGTNPAGATYTYSLNGSAPSAILDDISQTIYYGNNNLVINANYQGCTLTNTVNVYSGSNPFVSLGTSNSIGLCPGNALTFTINPIPLSGQVNPPGTSYTMTYSDSPGTSNVFNDIAGPTSVSHNYLSTSCGMTYPGNLYPANTFYAQVTAQNYCGQTSSTVSPITVNDFPIANFTVTDSTICANQSITVTNTGDAGSVVGNNAPYNCNDQGKFYWTITGGVNGVNYTVTTGVLGFFNNTYNNPNGSVNTVGNGSSTLNITFITAGTYTITQHYHNGCGTKTKVRNICVINPPTCQFTATPSSGCTPLTVAINNTTVAPTCGGTPVPLTYAWTVTSPSGTTASYTSNSAQAPPNLVLTNPTTTPQTFTISLTVTPKDPYASAQNFGNPNCISVCTQTVTVNPKPTYTPTNLSTCTNPYPLSVNLQAGTNIANSTFTWSATSNSNVSGESTTAQTTSTINNTLDNTSTSFQTVTYTVTPTSNLGCVGNAATFTVTLNYVDPGVVSSDQTICNGTSPAVLSGTTPSGAGTVGYQWQSSTNGTTWTNITNATGATYQPGPLSALTYFRRIVTYLSNGVSCTGTSNMVTITVNTITPGTISTAQNLCTGDDPAALNVVTGATGTGTTTFIWQQSSNATGPWTAISGQIGSSYDPPVLGSTTFYSIAATSVLNAVSCSANTPAIAVTVYTLTPGSISSSQTICTGGDPAAFTSVAASTNASSVVYQWQISTDNISWTNITSATSATFDPSALTTTTYYRRLVNVLIGSTVICQGQSNTITVTVVPDPTVSAPTGQTICTGGTPTALSVTANGGTNTNYSYLWFNSSNLSQGVTTSTFTPPASNGTYYCQVTINPAASTGCSVNSSNAQISVVADPLVTAPTSASYCQDAASVNALSVSASGGISTSYSYQWYVNTANNNTGGTLISGATSATFTPPVNLVGIRYYYCIVSILPAGTGCSTTSSVATITVTAGPSITNQPASQTRCIGGTFSALSFTSTGGSGTPTYQWYSNTTNSNSGGTLISGATSATYTPPSSLSATAGITYFYCVISFSSTGGCSVISTNATALTVLATPTVNPISNQVFCKNTVAPSTPISANYGSGMTYTWSVTGSSVGLTPTTGSTSTIPSFTTVNNGTAPLTATVNITPTYTTGSLVCAGSPTAAYTITVNPTPVMPAFTPLLFVFCENATGSVPFSSNISSNMSYSWTNDNTLIGLPATGTSTSPGAGISFLAVNNSNQPLTSNLIVTPSYVNGGVSCPGAPIPFGITINPLPDVIPLPDYTICATSTGDNQFSSLNPIIGLGTTYAWSNSNPAIGMAASGNGSHFFTATNTSLVPITSNVTVTPTYTNNGVMCTGTADQFVITVNPMPTVNPIGNQGLCVGSSTTAVTPTGNIPGTLYTWSNNNTSTGLGSGSTGTIPSFTGLNSTNAPNVSTVSVVPSYTFNNITCTGTAAQFGININPTPNVNPIIDQQVCAQSNASVQFSSTPNIVGTVYNWTNNNTAIGLAASGTGALSFNATNTTSAPLSATITVTPSFTNAGSTCWGPPQTFNIVVLPTPVMSAISNQTVCSGTSTAAINFTSNLTGTQYAWTNSNATIGLLASGSGSSIGAFAGVNTGTQPAQGLISVSPSLVTNNQTCVGSPVTATITVNPIPVLNNLPNIPYCHGAAANVAFGSSINTGVTYAWTNSNTAIGLMAGNTGNLGFTTQNNTTTATSAQITVTPTYTNNSVQCPGAPATFTIQVGPNPVANTLSNQVFCNNVQSTVIALTSAVPNTTFAWANSNTTIGLAASGNGNIPVFTTVNTSTNSVATSLITVNPSLAFNGLTCNGPSITFPITINPTTTINAVPNVQLCNGQTSIAINFSGTGTNYAWANTNNTIGIGSSGTGTIAPFTGTNSGTTINNATITATSQYIGGGLTCNGNNTSFTISVLPTPTVIDPPNVILCNGSVSTAVNLTGVATNYTWTNSIPSIGLTNTNTTAIIPSFTATNTGPNPVVSTVNITPSYVSGTKTCTGTAQSYTITVIPTPNFTTQPQDQTVCLGGTLNNLSVAFAGGSGTPTYQWYSSSTNNNTTGTAIPGATTATLTLPAATAVGTTYYYCQLTFPNSGTCSVIVSNLAEITITNGPTVSTPPLASQSVCVGGTIAPLTIGINGGTGTPTYQWYTVNGSTYTPIAGATSINYTPPTFTLSGTYNYAVLVTQAANGCATTYSPNAQVVVVADPTVSTPSAATYCQNATGVSALSVTPTNGVSGGSYTYQWYTSTSSSNTTGIAVIPGATSSTYTPPVTSVGTSYYFCQVQQNPTTSGCLVNSPTAAITVNLGPSFTTQPIPTQTICVGGSVSTLTVAYAGGFGAPTYQWFQNTSNSNSGGTSISGANSASFIVPNSATTTAGNYFYYCQISFNNNSGCSLISSAVGAINVLADPIITTQPTATQTICVGGSISPLSFAFSGGPSSSTPSYQWYSVAGANYTPITTNGTSATYAPPSSIYNSTGSFNYAVIITQNVSGCASTYSASAQLNIVADPTTTSPVGANYCQNAGNVVQLTVAGTAGITAPYTYQWFVNSTNSNVGGSAIPLETNSTFTPPVSATGTDYYYCVVSQAPVNAGCSVASNPATITVTAAPSITTQPIATQSVCVGGILSALAVAYSGGSGTPSYQWFSNATNSYVGGAPLTNATAATFTPPAATTPGTTFYYCQISFVSNSGCSQINSNIAQITVVADPIISAQPTATQAICSGGTIPSPFSVSFTNGIGTPTYQWFSVSGSTNTSIAGATAATYTPPVLNTVGTYNYMVQITLSGNGCGQIQSTNATITVVADPSVTNPIGASYCLNSSTALTLSVTASGGVAGPYTYQWFATNVNNNTSGSPITGATANAYIPPATTIGTIYYYCVVSQGVGCSVNSNPAGIIITPAPSISTQPMATQNVCVGGTLTALTVAYADGSGVPAYQWYSNSVNSTIGGVAIAGATGTSYTPSTALAGTTYFYCVITFSQSGCSSVTSNIGQVIVSPDPVVTTQPLNTQTICSGGSIPAALNVAYNGGTGSVSYQWFSVNGTTNTLLTGATAATYQPPVFGTAGTFNYAVQVTLSGSGCGMVQSNNAQVIVLPDPTVSAPIAATYCNGYTPVQPLSVTANGGLSAAYTYQWFSNSVNSNASGTAIIGATSPNFTPPVNTNGSVYYYCVVSQGAANTGCSIASATALVITSPAPAIATQPTTMQTACVGGTLNNLTVSYTGASTTPSYQWYSNTTNTNTGGTPVPGATAATYLPQNSTAGTTYYYCVISFPAISCTTISSNPGGVTIHPDPIISVQPIANQAICFGTTLSAPLNISYTGGFGTPSYQWNIVNGSTTTAIQNATNATYLPGNFNLAGTYNFNVTLTLSGNGCNVQTSNQAEVIVMPVPVVDSVGSELYCNDDLADLVHFTGPITGTTYSWVNDNPGIGLAASGFGDIVPFTVTNMNNFGIIGNISVTPQLTTYNTVCSGTPVAFQIMVNPYQDVQDPQDLILCHGTGVNGVQFFGSALINNWTNDLPALGIPAAGSGTLPAFLAVNNGTQPIIANLSVTPSFNAVTTCPGDIETFTITILPNPNASVVPATQIVCSGDLSATINMSGTATSFAWTNNQTSIGLPASGTGNIPAFLTTATGSNTTSTIAVTPIYTFNGVSCPGPVQNTQISVVPTPSVLPLQDLVYCNGDATNLIQILGNANELNWSSSNPSIGTAAIGTGSIASFNVNNPSQNPVSTVITVTPVNFFGGLTCMAPAEDFSITVNPTPTINPIADQVLCAQSNSPAILFSGNANSFSWSNSNTNIGLINQGLGNLSSFLTQNNLPSVISSNISVTPQFTNAGLTCEGSPELFTIDVLPVPTLGVINPQILCNGSATAPITFTGNATNYAWINNNVSIGLAGAGSGNIAGFNAVAGATNNVANLVVTPSYVYNSTTCVGTPATTTITVLPSPFINTVQDVVACNGDLSGILAFSGTANTFNWTNSNPSIGLAANGSGNLPVFTNTNASSNPLLATITVTPQTGQGSQTCEGTPEIFTITVNPTPTMLPPGSQVLCSQTQTQPVNFSGNASSYAWLNSNTSIGLSSFGNGAIPAFNAQNNGLNTQIAQIQVTPQYVNAGTTCIGTPQNFTFSVDPIPTVQYSQISQTVCTGSSTTAVNLSSQTPGVAYSWNILNPSGAITGVPSMNGTGNLPSMTLVNSGNVNEQFNFQGMAVTPLASCVGYGPLGTINVAPAPVMQPLNDLTICSNSLINYSLVASLPSTFSWTASANTNVVGQPTSAVNSNLIFNTLQNNAATLQYVTYTVTPISFPAGCIGAPESFIAEVVPNIQITNVLNYEICSGEATDITLSSNLPGAFTYTATNNPNVQGESSNTQPGFYINDVLSNNTSYDQIVSYNIQVSSNPYGCYGLPQVVYVEVHPEMTITNASPTQICSGTPLNLTLTATENATFSWYATQNGLITGESTTAQNTNVLNDNLSLIAGANIHDTVQYTISATSTVTGCDAQSLPFSIIVNPVPLMNANLDTIFCAGETTDPYLWNGTANNYAWTNSNSSIGLALSGSGNIPAFNVNNLGIQTTVSSITVVPQYINNGFVCAGTPDLFTITVEPIPSIAYNIPNQDLCSGDTSDLVAISSPTNGVNITWEIINPPLTISGIPNLTGSNNIPPMILSNSSTSPQQILFQGTVSTPLNACELEGPIGQIVVLPEPVIANINDLTICSNDVLSVAINSSIPATFSWGAQSNPNVNGESVGPINSNFIYNTLLNTTSALQYVNYTITPTSINGACVGVDQDFTVEVIPNIILDTNFTNLYDSICSGDLTNVLLQTNYPANIIWYALNNPNVTGETTIATAGNYISDILVNNTPFNQYVTYYVDMLSSPNACQGIPQTITIKVFPAIQLTNATNINLCSNEQLDLNLAATVNANFTWYATNNGVVQGESTTPQNTSLINDLLINNSSLTEQVNYAVDVVALNSGCVAYDLPITVNVLPLPVLLNNDTTICSGELTNVNLVTNIPASIIWNGVFNIPIIGETYANISGSYINDLLVNNTGQDDTLVYEVWATANGCTAPLDSVLVIVHDQPDVDFSVLTNPLCSEDTIQFTNLSNPNFDFDWSFGDGGTSVAYSPTHIYNNSGIYEVMLVGTNPLNNCSAADSTTIVVNKMPDASFYTMDTIGCGNLNATFYANYQSTSDMVWDFGDGQTLAQVGNVTNYYGQAGCYDVTLTVTSPEGCVAQESYDDYVCVYENPIAFIGASPTSVNALNPTVQFSNSSQHAISYIWQMGDGGISYDDNPTYTYPMEGADYHVLMTAFNEVGCFDTASIDINVFEELIFYVPNTFTPNDDEKNQTFYPVLSQGMKRTYMEFYIYNRWGELVFESHDPSYGWDGTYGPNALDCPIGTYTWKLKLETLQTQEILDFHGHVNLIR